MLSRFGRPRRRYLDFLHQFTATMAPLMVIAPPAETSPVADAFISVMVPEMAALTLAFAVMLTPEISTSVSDFRVIFLIGSLATDDLLLSP